MKPIDPDERNEFDEEVDIISHSPYYSVESLPNCLGSDNSNFTTLSINTDSFLSKIDEIKILLKILENHNIQFDCICIQESHLDDSYSATSQIIHLDGYACIPQGKYCGQKGGLITFFKSKYKGTKLDIVPRSNMWEGLVVDIVDENSDLHVIVGNIYKPPRNNNNNGNIEHFMEGIFPILQYLDRTNVDVVLPGDYNINLLKINERAKFAEFFYYMLSHSFYPKITLPTRIGTQSSTIVDNIYCKLSENSLNSEAGIIFTNISDHFPCFLSIKCKNKTKDRAPKFVKQRVNTPYAQEAFKSELLEADIYHTLNNDINVDPTENYRRMMEKVTELKNKHLPYRKVKFNKHKHKDNKWITYGLIRSIKYRDNLNLELKKLPSDTEDYAIKKQNLKVFNSILKRSIREAKVSYYEHIFEKYKNDMKNTWKNISSLLSKSNKNTNSIKTIKVNGKDSQDKTKIANAFNDFFVNVGPKLAASIDTSNKRPFNSYLTKRILTSFNFSLMDIDSTSKVINSLKTKTSTGHDGISVKMLKFLAPALISSLTLIINQSLITGVFPDLLKIARVIPLYKKDDKTAVDNYRPVSLLCAISKVFEKVAFNQLYTYLKNNNILYKGQYGFREQHSTELASLELTDRILMDLDNKKNPVTVYMDLSKAFDTLDHSILLQKLRFYGVREVELQWFQSYLTNRVQYVDIDGFISEHKILKTGVPQGSILGPLLFLIYMNDIPESSEVFDFILYADDTSLKSIINIKDTTKSLAQITYSINKELNNVNDWLAVNKLSLNVTKTKFMVFHTLQQNISSFIPQLKIGNKLLERVSNFNFLGLTINENMSWKPHVNLIANKISKYVGILNRLKRYLPCRILRMMYFSIVHSNLNYSLLAWGYDCGRLKKLQKRAVRTICNAKYNDHTEPLMKTLGILKLEDLFKLNMLKWYYRYTKKQLPRYFLNYEIMPQSQRHQHNTRLQSLIALPPKTRIQTAKYCLRNHIHIIINSVPKVIIEKVNTHSYNGFSSYVKNAFLSSYSLQCSIESCYICNR